MMKTVAEQRETIVEAVMITDMKTVSSTIITSQRIRTNRKPDKAIF
jgi:hypothetical protein